MNSVGGYTAVRSTKMLWTSVPYLVILGRFIQEGKNLDHSDDQVRNGDGAGAHNVANDHPPVDRPPRLGVFVAHDEQRPQE